MKAQLGSQLNSAPNLGVTLPPLLAWWRYWPTHVHPSIWILLLLSRLQDLKIEVNRGRRNRRAARDVPGRSIIEFRLHSSSHPHYRTLHSN